MNVLLVEDCELTIDIVTWLAQEDHPDIQITLAKTKAEATKKLQETPNYDIVFLDWHLPDGTSEWLAWLVYLTQSDVIEIVWTSSSEDKRIMQVQKEGATSHCAKEEIVNVMWRIKSIFANETVEQAH